MLVYKAANNSRSKTLANQNLFMFDDIQTVVRCDVWTIIFILHHFTVRMNKNLP